MDLKKWVLVLFSVMLLSGVQCSNSVRSGSKNDNNDHPRIVNIINFIRLLEPRDARITEDVLYQTVVKQVDIMRRYSLRGTFLLQYDALTDSRYQDLLGSLPADSFEIGAWWEIPQPLVEKAGLVWRGRFPWDWHADVGFSTGYTPGEREKLIDVYMTDFRKIFGYYPKSVGSWFIDAHSLNYLYDKYHIVASCNCKDQSGTDGYTLWGGYWSQAYYPSRLNSYMPAQKEESQLPVPVFRMLGSDPVRQYDTGLGAGRQGVISLEPVYRNGGANETWVNWYFEQFTEGPCMEYAYVQAGQENSFTWDAMAKGFEIQMPLIARLKEEGKIKVETLAESGKWFKEHYKVTPATSVTVKNDLPGSNRKTVWFNSRFYRVNILWEDSTLRIRDIHLFNEDFPSYYTSGTATSNQASFFTLPFIDGYLWSTRKEIAGLRLKALEEGNELPVKGGEPLVTDSVKGLLHISWPLLSFKGTLLIDLSEKEILIKMQDNSGNDNWFFDMNTAENAELPFQKIEAEGISCCFDEMEYTVTASKGKFSEPDGVIFRLRPEENVIKLNLCNR